MILWTWIHLLRMIFEMKDNNMDGPRWYGESEISQPEKDK